MVRKLLKQIQIRVRKRRLRTSMLQYQSICDQYDCGTSLTLELSTEARQHLTRMVHDGQWLADNDPEAFEVLPRSIYQWSRLLNPTTYLNLKDEKV